jgi:hypothetical protein
MLIKNTASQKWKVFAFSVTTGLPVTGDASNITANIDKDYAGVAAVTDTNPTESEDGYYVFDLTQAETNADILDIYPESATSNVVVLGAPANLHTRLEGVGGRLAVDAVGISGSTSAADNVEANIGNLDASVATLDTVADAIKVITDQMVFTNANELDVNVLSVGGTTQTAGDVTALVTTVDTVVDGIQTDLSNGTDGLGAIKTVVDTLAVADTMEGFFQIALRSDAAITTDRAAILTLVNADEGSGAGDYVATTESQEALRDRGDAAYLTATGFSTHSALDVWHVATSAIVTASTIGIQVKTNLDAVLTARTLATAAYFDATTDNVDLNADQSSVTIGTTTAVSNGVTLATSEDIYWAHVQWIDDDGSSKDEYTVTWFLNGARITSGITSPTIQVVKRVDGTDLVSSAAMTQIGSTGSYKYDEASNRIPDGESYLVVVGATIDSGSRAFSMIVGRDTTA